MEQAQQYVRLAEEATKDNAHVSVLFNYRNAVECAGYVTETAPVLLEAVKYAQRLKKEKDKATIAVWGIEALGRIQNTSLAEIINQEIAKLQTGGKESATT